MIGEHVRDQHAMGDSYVDVTVEGGWAGSGKGVSGAGFRDRAGAEMPTAKERVRAESQNRAGVDELTAKGRSAGSSTKRAHALVASFLASFGALR